MKPFRFFFLMFVMIFFAASVSAFEFDNIKSYNENTKTVTVTNALGFGEVIGQARLNTPLNVVVPLGYQKVAEFDLWAYQDYNDVLRSFEFYDERVGRIKINRDFDIKYKINETVIVEDYGCVNTTENPNCTPILLGTHEEVKEAWVKLTPADLKKNEHLTIGLFTEVQRGDLVEWIPVVYGVRVDEWAYWQQSYSAGLVSYFDLNNSYYDTFGGKTLTPYKQPTFPINGYRDEGLYTNGSNFLYGNQFYPYETIATEPVTVLVWFNSSDITAGDHMLAAQYGSTGSPIFEIDRSGAFIRVRSGRSAGTTYFNCGNVTSNTWYQTGIISNSSGIYCIFNGGINTSIANTNALSVGTLGNFSIGAAHYDNNHANDFGLYTGMIDEVLVYNRSLTATELLDIYNAVSPYNIDNSPVVYLDSPANNTNYSSNGISVDFKCRAADDVSLSNITFYLYNRSNGSLIYSATNTDGQNNTLETFTYILTGNTNYTWNCKATDNSSQSAFNSTNWTVNVFGIPDNAPSVSIGSGSLASGTNMILSQMTVNFNCSYINDDYNVDNVSLIVNNVIINTSLDPANNSNVVFTNIYTDGFYEWYCKVVDNSSQQATTTTRNFTINTTPLLEIVTPTPNNNTNHSTTNLTVKIEVSDITDSASYNYFDNMTIYLYNSSGLYASNLTEVLASGPINYAQTTFNITRDGTYYLNATTYSTTGQNATTETRIFRYDITSPTITLTQPNATYAYIADGGDVDLNWTVSDTHLSNCWFIYNGTTVGVSCTDNHSTFEYVNGVNNVTFYANDTYNNTINSTKTFIVKINVDDEGYPTSVIEGAEEWFYITYNIAPGYALSNAYLVYNGTANLGQLNVNGQVYNITYELEIPNVEDEANVSFYWHLILNDSSTYNHTTHNTSVGNLDIDNCSNYSNLLFNFTIVDEDSKNLIASGTTLLIDISFYDEDKEVELISHSVSINNSNPYAVCLKSNPGDSLFILDATIQYSSDGRFSEFYNILNYELLGSSLAQNITLYDLNSTTGTPFKVTYKNRDFALVPGALVQIYRKYIQDGTYYIVELPRNGGDGTTIGHFIVNDAIYKLIFVGEDGTVLATFDDVTAKCQNPALQDCEINVNSFTSSVEPSDYTQNGTFSSTLGYEPSTRTVSASFVMSTGVATTGTLNVTLYDGLGTTSVCNDALYAVSGTLECEVPITFGNSTIIAKVYSNNAQKKVGIMTMHDEPQAIYGASIVFIALIVIFLFIGMSINENPVFVGIMSLVGFILLIVINVITTPTYIGAGATILWLVLSVILILIKGGNRN